MITLADPSDVVHFEKGMEIRIPFDGIDRHIPSGTVTVSHVDRFLGVIKAGTSPDRVYMNPKDYEALRRELDAGYDKLAESMSNALYRTGGGSVARQAMTAAQVGIAATVTLAGLGWIIARRNLLADAEDSESWAKSVMDWILALVRGLLGDHDVDA